MTTGNAATHQHQIQQDQRIDRFGNAFSPNLPYARGSILSSTADEYRKLRRAWRIIAERHAQDGRSTIYNLSGLERGYPADPSEQWLADDDFAPAFHLDRLVELALEHLGGNSDAHEIAVFNRLTAATYAVHAVLAGPGDTVVGVSASHSHPSVARAASHVGARLIDTTGYDAFARAMEDEQVRLVVLTRLAVTYDILRLDEIQRIIELAHSRDVVVYLDDAGGARVGPAIFDQPRMLDLGADIGCTGLDKYGTIGPRLGLMGGRRDLVSMVRARGFEMGLEARPLLYGAVKRSLEQYSPDRVRALVDTTMIVAEELKHRLGSRIQSNEIIARLPADDTLEIALERSEATETILVPYEATAALAMLLLRDHGILTVHFAGLPPGTSSILFKFMPPETLERFGGPERFAAAVDGSLDSLAQLISSPGDMRSLLVGE